MYDFILLHFLFVVVYKCVYALVCMLWMCWRIMTENDILWNEWASYREKESKKERTSEFILFFGNRFFLALARERISFSCKNVIFFERRMKATFSRHIQTQWSVRGFGRSDQPLKQHSHNKQKMIPKSEQNKIKVNRKKNIETE